MSLIINLIKLFYWKLFFSNEEYARYLGVNIDINNLIQIRNWGSEPYLITIGSNCQITDDVRFHTHGGGQVVRRNYPNFDIFGKIVIEDWAYIGAKSQIMPGVTIGSGTLVAAGSIVTKSVAPGTVVGGNPAKYICTVEEYYRRNCKFDLSSKNLNENDKKKLLLSLSDDKFITK
jgi:acetyltransferase-like isoleucine patch superfamily enzyme